MAQPNFIPSPSSIPQPPLPTGKIFPVKSNAKTPLTKHGFQDASDDPKQIELWMRKFGDPNWGMPTGGRISVLDIDLDKHPESTEWLREQESKHGSLDTLAVQTPSGGIHLYFQIPEGIKLKTTAGQISVGVDTRGQGGYIVIPPSVIDGKRYKVINDVPPAPIPDWLLALWPRVGERWQQEYPTEGVRIHAPIGDLLNTPIPTGQRSTRLASIAGHLWNHMATVEELEHELLAAHDRLCSLPLPIDEVLAIAQSISRYPKASGWIKEINDDPLSWPELESAVSHDPCTGYFKQGRSGPRRRFPQVTDRAEIRHIRERLNQIWMQTQQRLGYQDVYDRAERCGHLPAQQCRDCKTTFSEGTNHRYNCKARLHPLCLVQIHD